MPSRADSSLKPLGFDPRAMLLTPSKTPRKRPAESEAALNSTARVLFPTRKGNHFSLTLSSYEELDGGAASSSKIQIYTDSKERVPSVGDEEENPFLSKNAKPRRIKAKTSFTKRRKSAEERAEEMEEAARNDEGMIYPRQENLPPFRSPPTSGPTNAADDSDAQSDDSIRRKAGASSRRLFTRSTIQPRLLFPNESQRHDREAVDEEDEEAATDIELPVPVPTPRRSTRYQLRQEMEEEVLATPPATGRATRSATRKETAEHETPPMADTSELQQPEDTPLLMPMHATRSKKASPFDSWRRTKQGSKAAPKGTKRQAEPMERGEASGKRVRSGMHLDS
ncbi:hypothetical protein H2199_000310 [Coniosporium tulheliwenetii]|uniref:Uncharacterized protein n=1 Tax=Coniosporium tulheliwenetii TaxID=3383036 RepID=A0ACC2ZPY7_9PEZI|nr:hypothetical protein H2199_000310 [Cladosporium sp. JES 115]